MNFIRNWNVYPLHDIGNRVGFTDYIDFISEQDVENDVMTGIDVYKRPFIVVKAKLLDNNKNEYPVFETFFQRYTDNDVLFMGCGHDGTKFMDTSGGMTVHQKEFLNRLVQNKKIELNSDILTELRLSYNFMDSETKNNLVSIELRS